MRGAPHPAKWQEVSRRLQSNAARPDLTLETWNSEHFQMGDQGGNPYICGGGRMCGLIFLELNLWLYQGQAGFCYTETEFAYFQNHWVGSLCSGSGRLARPQHVIRPDRLKSTPSPRSQNKNSVSVQQRQPALKSLPTILSLPHLDIIIQSKNYQPSVW